MIKAYLDLCRQEQDAWLAFALTHRMRVSRVCPVSDAVQNLIEMEFREAKRRLEQLRERKRAARDELLQLVMIGVMSAVFWFLNLFL